MATALFLFRAVVPLRVELNGDARYVAAHLTAGNPEQASFQTNRLAGGMHGTVTGLFDLVMSVDSLRAAGARGVWFTAADTTSRATGRSLHVDAIPGVVALVGLTVDSLASDREIMTGGSVASDAPIVLVADSGGSIEFEEVRVSPSPLDEMDSPLLEAIKFGPRHPGETPIPVGDSVPVGLVVRSPDKGGAAGLRVEYRMDVLRWLANSAAINGHAVDRGGGVLWEVAIPASLYGSTSASRPFELVLKPSRPGGGVSLLAAADGGRIAGSAASVSVGATHRQLAPTDLVEFTGMYTLGVEYAFGGQLRFTLRGRAKQLRVNGASILPTRWESFPGDLRSALLGGLIGFFSGFLLSELRRSRSKQVQSRE